MMKLGLVTPTHVSSKADPLEPLKVDLGMIKSFSEEVGLSTGSITPKKLSFALAAICASDDEAVPSQSLSPEKDCSTASGSETEGATSGGSAADCADEDE